MNADDKFLVIAAARVDALRLALDEACETFAARDADDVAGPLCELRRMLDDTPDVGTPVLVDAGPTDMFRAEVSEGHAVRCVLDGQEVGCKSVVVRGVFPVPEPIMVLWADARPGMMLVDRNADGEITGVVQVSTCTDDHTPTGKPLAWWWVWTPWIEWDGGETWLISDGWQVGHESDAVHGELVAALLVLERFEPGRWRVQVVVGGRQADVSVTERDG